MRLLGQGSPTLARHARARYAAIMAAAGAFALVTVGAFAAEMDVRLRFAWGSGGQSPQKWQGRISVSEGTFSDLQPLGIEADEAAALRLVDNEVRVAPLVRRAFDGCDITVRGDEAAIVRIELQYSRESPAKVIEAPLSQVANEQFRASLDDLGGGLLIHRAPGDRLRVLVDRPHLVFGPGEAFNLQMDADLAAEAQDAQVTIVATVRRVGDGELLEETELPFDPAAAAPIAYTTRAPRAEGAYRITFVAQRKAGLASRLVPWERNNVLATRDVEFVVVDPEARLPQLTDSWETVATIDPANSSWWQRAPQWTQFDKLPGFSAPRPLGSIRPTPVAGSPLGLVELPAMEPIAASADSTASAEPAWQAYLLAVRRVGEPHAVEIEIPRDVSQHLGVSIIEPDAAGRVMSFGRDCGVYSEPSTIDPANPTVEIHRVVFWPRTKSPGLLLTNRSTARPVQYGKIRLLRRVTAPAADVADDGFGGQRLVAAYIATPRFADTFGAGEEMDAGSGLSVDGWNTFLTAANRLAQQLRASGYNAAIISIAAEGASLAPIDSLGASPRFDTGLLSAHGGDPIRKDVLEVLLRVFDREGLRLIPAVQLGAPMPGLEALAVDVRHRGSDGRTWLEHFPAETAVAPHYNLLHAGVQTELNAVSSKVVARYGHHPSFAGLSLQLAGNGYGLLPGLDWGMDDATIARFAEEQQLKLPGDGPARYRERAAIILGKHLVAWNAWRQAQLTRFYTQLALQIAGEGGDRKLVLAMEDIFTGHGAASRLRQAVSGRASVNDALDEIGLDLKQLAAAPGVVVLRPRRFAAEDSVDARAVDHRVNTALELDHAFASQPGAGDMLYHASSRLRLASFDAQSPFGAEKTHLALNSASLPAGDAARQPLAAALTSHDFVFLAAGADSFPVVENGAWAGALRTFRELPLDAADIRTERRQPITLRVYREAESTTVCLINESQWSVGASIPLDCTTDVVWRQLGAESTGPGANAVQPVDSGALPRGQHKLEITLAPYAIQARRYSSHNLRVGDFTPELSPEAAKELARRVRGIEERMAGLNVERAYNELQNPNFELVDDHGRLRGWQPRMGQRGAVEVAFEQSPANRSVHLRSEDGLGVAVQSHLFAIPSTGQIVVRAKVRGAELQPGARLYAWVEYESGGAMRPRYVSLGDHSLPSAWTEREFAIDDLPLAASGKMRIQFHLTGGGQVWVDDVRLFDLRFADAQRVELSKRLLGAKAALEDSQLMDCQRLVDGYLPRRVMEHIPPPALAAKPEVVTPAQAPEEAEETGLGPRIRGMVPKILR
jgi:hypothetical protein